MQNTCDSGNSVWVLILFGMVISLGGCGGGEGTQVRPPFISTQHAQNLSVPGPTSKRLGLDVPPVDPTSLMDWAEKKYPQYFPGHQPDLYWQGYIYRFYPQTGSYLGVEGFNVRVLGPMFGPNMVDVGTLSDFTCQVKPTLCSPIPAATPLNGSYSCFDRRDFASGKCFTSVYPFKWNLTSYQFDDYLRTTFERMEKDNISLLSCKQSSACIENQSGLSMSEIRAMKQASSAVVRITLTSNWIYNPATGMDYGIASACTGTVIQNDLDSTIYVMTAAHCFYSNHNYYSPLDQFSSYRESGLPLYVTFHFEQDACRTTSAYPKDGGYTVPALPVARLWTQDGWSAPSAAVGAITDIALLQLVAPLPAGVTPVRVSSQPLTATERLFTYTHPLQVDKTGGSFDGGIVLEQTSGYQYVVKSSSRLVEPGSSGGPLFAYEPSTGALAIKGTLTASSNPPSNTSEACRTSATAIYGRLDRHAPQLNQYIGKLSQ